MTRFAVRVQPGASTNKIVGWFVDTEGSEFLKIRLRAPAVEGKANAALVDFLAESLGVRPRELMLERGDKSREKIVRVNGLTMDEIRNRTV